MAETGGREGPTLARVSGKAANGPFALPRHPFLVRRPQFGAGDEIIKRVNDVPERGGTGIIVLSGRS